MIALIAKLVPLLKQLAPLVRELLPILSAIFAVLIDAFGGTHGAATVGLVAATVGHSVGKSRVAAVALDVGPYGELEQGDPNWRERLIPLKLKPLDLDEWSPNRPTAAVDLPVAAVDPDDQPPV